MHRLLAFLLFFCLQCTLNAAITIDDFSAGPMDVTLTEASPSSTLVQTGLLETAVIGGNRKHLAILNGPILPGSEANIVIDTFQGTFRVTSNASIEASRLSYGLGPGGEPGPALDLDVSAFDAFQFDVLSSAEPGIVGFTVGSGRNEDASGGFSDIITFPASATPYSLIVPFSRYSLTSLDFSDIDYIRLNGGGFDGFDFILDGIFVVPEPSTAALLLLTIVFAFSRRQRRI